MDLMRDRLYKLVTLVALLSLLLGACGPQPTPAPTDTPTATPEPSPTPPPYTPPPPGNVSPRIIQRAPEAGEELPPDGAIELVFDRAMDKASVEKAIQVSPDVSGELEWADDNTAHFEPARDLKRDQDYYVTLGAEARAADGGQLDGAYRFRFRTVGYLEVSQVIPAPEAQDVEAESTITVMFNRPVVPLMAVSDPGYGDKRHPDDLPQPISFDPPIEGQGEWINTSIYAFTPEGAMAGGTNYTARVEAGLTDTTGGLLEEAHEWTFTTQPPKVTWVSPEENGDLISVEPIIKVQFNMPIDPASAEQAFSLRGGGATVDGELDVLTDTLIFTPTEQLAFDTVHTARIDAGVQSVGGGEGMRNAYEWRFTTVPLPRIVRTSPRDGDQSANPHRPFEIIFNAPIDPTTVMPNIEMTPPISPARVYTSFSTYDNTFRFDFNSKPSTDYQVRIGPDIADPYGNTTGQEMTVQFRTAALDPWVQVDVPGMIGTYDAHQPAQISIGYVNVSRLDLRLYRLELKDYFSAQERFWERETPGVSLREWSVPVEPPLNEKAHTLIALTEGGGRLEPGLYLLEVTAPNIDFEPWLHRKLLSVSDYNLTIKKSEGELWAWATDLATGQPVSGLPLTVHYAGAEPVGPVPTDEGGLAHIEFEPEFGHILHVVSEDPFVLGGIGWEWEQGIGPWDFGLRGGTDERNYRAHVTTDRPIYRAGINGIPGQTVYFRGVLRAEDDVSYQMTRFEEIQVRIYDPESEEVFNDGLPLDEFGTFHGELPLDEGATLGDYRIAIRLDDYNTQASFTVAAYRPPEFEVVVTPEKEELASGQATRADVDVSYFFGGAVADAEVAWRVLSAPYTFDPVQFGRYDFTDEDSPWICRWCWWQEPPRPEPLLTGSGATDAQGHLGIDIPTRVMTGGINGIPGQRLTIEATAYGKDGQAISGRSDVVVHRGNFYVGLAPQQYVGNAGEPFGVDVVTVDWEAQRLPDKELDVEAYRREWVNTFVEDAGGGGSWEWETKDTLVYTDTLTTDQNAEGEITFTPQEGGSYQVVVSGRDAQERLVQTSTWVWVSGEDDVAWRRDNNDRFDLISDKVTYVPGETAEILIPSPFEGEQWAWITVERGGVMAQEVRKLESNSAIYRLPITADHAPNVYVSVVIVKGPDPTQPVATHKVGYAALTVEPVEQTLDITVTPSSERAEPGDTVSFDVEVRDASGEPVEAAFSLDLVDKAVLSLKPREEENAIRETFYGRRGLGVSTSSGLVLSINRILLKQLEELDDIAMRGLGMGGGGGAEEAAEEAAPAMAPAADRAEKAAGEAEPSGPELRERFEDTAFWNPNVVTDRNGQASVEIELPDNLTTWVFRAVGVTKGTEVGEQTDELLVTKPLLVRPATPRFFVVGDRAQLAALVSNNTGAEQEVEVTLQAEGLRISESASQRVSVADGAEGKVTWWVEVEDVPYADVVMSAEADRFADAARPRLTTGSDGTLIVHRYSAPEIVGTGGQLSGEDARTEAIALPPKYDDRQGELSVRLDPSLAAGMVDGLDYLEHFPYECTEQIVSRFLPNVLTYRALQELGLADPDLEEKLPDLVEEGLSKLYQRQHDDGGWGWWRSREGKGQSYPHLTAYVVFAMDKAREAGFEVKGGVIERGLGYLRGELVTARDLTSYREANQQAFILYVMAEQGEGETGREGDKEIERHVDDLFESRDKLSHYGRAFLALAMGLVNENDNRIDTLLSDLQNAAIISATGAHWEEADYDYWAMNTDTRSTAVILDALARLDPENDLIPNVVRWLMVVRRDGIWETTYETAWALIALTDWMRVTGELQGDYDYAVWLNDELMEGGRVTPETVDKPIKLEVAVAELLRQVWKPALQTSNRLTIGRGSGEGRLYYTAHLKVYLPVEEIEPLNRGVIVSRHYSDPDCTEGLKCPEVETVEVGDVVQVHLSIIAPHDLYYVVVEDPLPAGAEAIDPSLATTSLVEQRPRLRKSTASEAKTSEVYRWWWNWYSRSEMRDDKMVLFADYLPAGTYEYTYTFRATRPGEYQVIPTNAREFYFPEVFGRGAGRLLTIEESE
jgi:alpha-2-macroglobulin